MLFRINHNIKTVNNTSVSDFYSSDFGQTVIFIAESCCFNVKNNYLIIKILFSFAHKNTGTVKVIYNICLTAVYYFKIFGLFVHGIRKSLYIPVVCYCYCLMSPFRCSFKKYRSFCYSVHN